MSRSAAALALRWVKFNAVGLMGLGVQLAMLSALVGGSGLDYRLATLLAVESALLHNFLWHEHYTWRERTAEGSMGRRLLQFHLANGMVSLVGNLGLMHLLVGGAGLHYLAANLISIAACGLVNFLVGEYVVFRVRRAD